MVTQVVKPYDSATPLLGVFLREMKTCIHIRTSALSVYSSIIHHNPKMETIQMSIKWWTDEQNVVHPFSGILLGNVNKWSIGTCYNMDEHYKQVKQVEEVSHKGLHIAWFHLCETCRTSKSTGRKQSSSCPGLAVLGVGRPGRKSWLRSAGFLFQAVRMF